MIRAVIIEDETLAVTRLETSVRQCDEEISIVAKLPSVRAAVQWFSKNPQPHLVFMDIHLEDGQSFSIFDQAEILAPVIFTTAFDEYTIQAFKVNSIDYLLKPIQQEELAFALDKFRKLQNGSFYYNAKAGEPSAENLRKSSHKSRFLVTSGARIISVPVGEVAYFFSEEKSTFLRTFAGQRYAVDHSLDRLVFMLDAASFFKINRQLIINIESIDTIRKVSTNRLKVSLRPNFEKDVFVSIRKYSEFKDWLDT